MENFVIATMSGSLKGVFVHGVLHEFELNGIKASAYASCSSSTLPVSYAAIGKLAELGLDQWKVGE